MDLMFMNSIVSSPTYPPMDAWLGGYPIPYYYFGYWMLTTLGLLSGQPPAIAYNLGQACWYGLLLSGSAFGVGYNLLAALGAQASRLLAQTGRAGETPALRYAGETPALIMQARRLRFVMQAVCWRRCWSA